ncbi:MAG: ADP-ribosylglycohydrolase family protein [bacterium]
MKKSVCLWMMLCLAVSTSWTAERILPQQVEVEEKIIKEFSNRHALIGKVNAITEERTITREELLDRIHAFWVGQLVGNYMGFPFENVYVEEPIPFLVDRYYTWQDDPEIKLNRQDIRGFVPMVADAFEGAFSDDDTDIEFVTLHAVEEHGLDLTYEEITEAWKRHINRKIWVANRTARNLMDEGLVAPDTGKKENNENWFQIDPQLVNEIWSAFYPGMTGKAAERAEWGARITNDDWGTHPTIAYGVMISAAFFEQDPEKLVQMAFEAIPQEGPFYEGMQDVIRWHREFPDWRETRKRIHEKYYRYKKGDYEAPVSVVSSLQNGLCGIMAILYGEGDFVKTVGIATSAGYDCDNQAATCGGLLGVLNGMEGIPDSLTKELPLRGKWEEPFNNQYLNYSRDNLPIMNKITDIVEGIAAIAEQAILENGGKKIEQDGKVVYVVPCDF